MDQKAEIAAKHNRVNDYLERHNLDAVILSSRANFAWLTAGRLNYVNAACERGVAGLVVQRDNIACVCSNIEQPRVEREELDDAGIELVDYPWYDGKVHANVIDKLVGRSRVGYDLPAPHLPDGAEPLGPAFTRLRWSLLPAEIDRYRHVGQLASQAIEDAIGQIKPAMTEHQIAAVAATHVCARSARPWVVLIAVDHRISNYRHPIPTDTKLAKIAMVVLCVEKFGLVCSLTRLISFGCVDDELRRKHDAVVNVDAALNLSSKPGRTLTEMLDLAKRAYSSVGFDDQWQLHHQGGPTGYQPRDCVATAGDTTQLVANQALAWNPSITGTKSENTIITTDEGPIFVTAATADWPTVSVRYDGVTLQQPDILVVS